EIDVSGGVDEGELVGGALVVEVDGDGVHLDGDAALALEVHVVEDLVAEVALGDGAGLEEELIAEGALAVVDVGDDREVADEFRIGHGGDSAPPRVASAGRGVGGT